MGLVASQYAGGPGKRKRSDPEMLARYLKGRQLQQLQQQQQRQLLLQQQQQQQQMRDGVYSDY